MFLGPFNTFCLWACVSIGVESGSAFLYPKLTKCLETVNRETSTPTSFNLLAIDLVEIVGCLRISCPIDREALGVIFLVRPLPLLRLISPLSFDFLRLLYIVLSGIFVFECISAAFPCSQKCKIGFCCASFFEGAILTRSFYKYRS